MPQGLCYLPSLLPASGSLTGGRPISVAAFHQFALLKDEFSHTEKSLLDTNPPSWASLTTSGIKVVRIRVLYRAGMAPDRVVPRNVGRCSERGVRRSEVLALLVGNQPPRPLTTLSCLTLIK